MKRPKNCRFRTSRTLNRAAQKYERETGNHIGADIAAFEMANIIAGETITRRQAWDYLIDYVKGEPAVSKQMKRSRDVERKELMAPGYTREKAKGFYFTPEWRSLRVNIIEDQKGRCQMCGRSYKDHGVVIHVDHIIPLSIDWSKRLDKNNLQLLCEDCNLGKSNHYTTDWRS